MMKKIFIFCLLFFTVCGIFAQEESSSNHRVAIGIGAEFNMNSRENFAGGVNLSLDYAIKDPFAAGVNFTASNNFSGITVLEPAAFFRWYFLSGGNAGLFAQAEAGGYLILEDGEITPMFLGGLRGGIRLPLGKTFYVEPFGRIGYPFVFGIGVLAGMRF